MKNKLILLIVILPIFLSCEKKNDFENENISLNYLFSTYANEFEKEVVLTNEIITAKKTLLSSIKNDTINRIDSLITSYYNYLDSIDLKSEELKENIFYKKDVLQEDGKTFKNTSEVFFKNINELIKDKHLKNQFYQNFNLDYVKNENNLHFLYMEYYYLDVPYSTFKFLIKKRKYNLRIFQNEILSSYLIYKK